MAGLDWRESGALGRASVPRAVRPRRGSGDRRGSGRARSLRLDESPGADSGGSRRLGAYRYGDRHRRRASRNPRPHPDHPSIR